MPTHSGTRPDDQDSTNVPSEIENLYLASQCPPGEDRPAPSTNDVEANGIIHDLPTPPHESPIITPHPMPSHSGARTPSGIGPLHRGLPHGVYFQEPQNINETVDVQVGSTEEVPGTTFRETQVTPSTQSRHATVSNEEITHSHNYLDSLRLLEAARHRDSRPPELSWRPQGYGSLLDSYGQPTTRSLQPTFDSSSAGSPREINIPNVRWPPTQYTPASLLEETRARLLNEPSSTPSGPTSSREETLRRAYHLLQDQTANQQHTRNTMPAYARLASGVDWMSRDQRSTTPQDSDSFSGLRHTSELLPTLGSSPHQNVGGSPSSTSYRHARQQSNDLVIDLPPLTPLSDPEGKDYDFRRSTSPEPRAIPSSPLTSSSDPTSGQPFHALKNHRFGRYQPSCLHNGAVFVGTQCSDRQEYKVKVEIKHVDMDESFLCGHLIIEGLTHEHQVLETYFEGEIIGSKYTFTTRHPDWGASEKQDMLHWNRFAAWKPLARQARQSDFSYKNFAEREHIFMRWKEYFLVPDHRVTAISGASFEGFYYICFNQKRGTFSGIYYHAKSEKWQQLELKHVAEKSRGCMPAVEMA